MFRRAGTFALGSLFALSVTACGGSVENSSATAGGGAGAAGTSGSSGGVGGTQSGGAGGTVVGGGGVGGSGGAACSLALVAAGNLPSSQATSPLVTGPDITATDDGFVIGYRVQDGATSRAVLLFLDDHGSLDEAQTLELEGCADQQPTDGVCVTYAEGAGLFATSVPNCGAGAGAVFVPFDSKGVPGVPVAPLNTAFLDLSVAQKDCLAPGVSQGEFEFVYRSTSASASFLEHMPLEGTAFKPGFLPDHPFGDVGWPFVMIATAPGIRAFLAPQPDAGLTPLATGKHDSDVVKSSGTLNIMHVADWAAITAWDDVVAAAIPEGAGLLVTVAGLEQQKGPTNLGSHDPSSAALAKLGTDLFATEGYPSGISLYRPDVPNTLAPVTVTTALDLQALGVDLSSFDGTHHAMAAARSRVALVWTSKPVPNGGDPVGGWALLDCSE